VVTRSVSSFTRSVCESGAPGAKLGPPWRPCGAHPFVPAVIRFHAPKLTARHAAAALLVAASAHAYAQSALAALPSAQDLALTPEATLEQRIDPWTHWTLRLYAQPAPAGDAAPQGGMEARFFTRRFDTHQLQAGAALAVWPAEAGPVEAWQAVDDHRSSVFVEDRWQWSSALSMAVGARVVGVPDGAAFHQRLALAWQPAGAWTLKMTQGALQQLAPPATGSACVQRFRGMEVQTEHAAGTLRLRVLAASQQVSDLQQSRVLHAAAVMLDMPLDARWTLGSQTLLVPQGDLTRLKLSGSLVRDRASVSLVVPHRFQGRPVGMAASLLSVEPDDGLGWRAQLELRF